MTKEINIKQSKHALVDDTDYRKLIKHKWYINSQGCVYRNKLKGGTVLMHREILELEPGDHEQVRHKNNNGLDNRRANLVVSGTVSCLKCGKEFTQNTPLHIYCWDCKHAVYLVRNRFLIYRRDKFQCAYCGRTSFGGAELHLDHIVPVALGGEGKACNVITSCKECNNAKHDERLDKDIELELLAEVERRNIKDSIIPETDIVDKRSLDR